MKNIMAKVLTAAGIKTVRPGAQRREIRDAASVGLYLVIQESGHKSFAMRFRRPDGRPSKLVLGVFDPTGEAEGEPVLGGPLTLAAARRLASELNRERARGKDLIADHQQRKAHRQIGSANTFCSAVADFVEQHVKRTRNWQKTSRLLGLAPDGSTIRGSLCDRWADRPIADISAGDVYSAVEETRTRGVPGLKMKKDGPSDARARHLFSALSVLFGWAMRHRRIEQNPCSNVHRPKGGQSRDRVLSNQEIREFWLAASAEPHVGPLLKLLLLTGQRLNEVAGMRRSELSADLWSLPGSRAKNGRPHVVPLPAAARDLIASVLDVHGSDLVFTTTRTSPVSGWTRVKRRLDARMGCADWVLHDLRRTMVTGLSELQIRSEVVEKIVNHVSGASRSGVAGVYNRSELLPERRAALERWSVHVASVVGLVEDRGVVIPLRA